MVSVAKLREIALALPETGEKPSHRIPTFRVKDKVFAALREELGAVAVKIDLDARDALLEGQPEIFFLTDHYRGYPYMLVRLKAVRVGQLRELLAEAWWLTAPKKLLRDHADSLGAE